MGGGDGCVCGGAEARGGGVGPAEGVFQGESLWEGGGVLCDGCVGECEGRAGDEEVVVDGPRGVGEAEERSGDGGFPPYACLLFFVLFFRKFSVSYFIKENKELKTYLGGTADGFDFCELKVAG